MNRWRAERESRRVPGATGVWTRVVRRGAEIQTILFFWFLFVCRPESTVYFRHWIPAYESDACSSDFVLEQH